MHSKESRFQLLNIIFLLLAFFWLNPLLNCLGFGFWFLCLIFSYREETRKGMRMFYLGMLALVGVSLLQRLWFLFTL